MKCFKKIVPGILMASIAFADNAKHNEIVKVVNKMDASHVQEMIKPFKIEHANIRRVLVEAVKISDIEIESLKALVKDPSVGQSEKKAALIAAAKQDFEEFTKSELETLHDELRKVDQAKKDEALVKDSDQNAEQNLAVLSSTEFDQLEDLLTPQKEVKALTKEDESKKDIEASSKEDEDAALEKALGNELKALVKETTAEELLGFSTDELVDFKELKDLLKEIAEEDEDNQDEEKSAERIALEQALDECQQEYGIDVAALRKDFAAAPDFAELLSARTREYAEDVQFYQQEFANLNIKESKN